MVIIKKFAILILLIFFAGFCYADEFENGTIRLILNQRNGSFSLLYLTDPEGMRYESMFYSNDPSTSFLTVNADGNIYRLGQSRDFQTRIERINGQPALVFESSSLIVTESFMPVKTPNSPNVNGVKLTVTIQNKGTRHSFIGLRMLFDTHLGEKRGRVPFITNSQLVTKEKVIEGTSGELFWLSRGQNLSVMGSIIIPGDDTARVPDYIHIANWKRLSDSPWELRSVNNRSFNYIPYSVGDSAVSYIYEPVLIEGGGTLTYSIYLTTEDIGWYNPNHPLIGIAWGRERARMMPPPAPEPIPEPEPAVPAPAFVPVLVPAPTTPAPEPIPEPIVPEPIIEPEPIPEPEPEPEPVVFIPEPVIIPEPAAITEYPHLNTAELRELYDLQDTLNKFIDGDIDLNEQDLLEIERAIDRLRAGH